MVASVTPMASALLRHPMGVGGYFMFYFLCSSCKLFSKFTKPFVINKFKKILQITPRFFPAGLEGKHICAKLGALVPHSPPHLCSHAPSAWNTPLPPPLPTTLAVYCPSFCPSHFPFLLASTPTVSREKSVEDPPWASPLGMVRVASFPGQ